MSDGACFLAVGLSGSMLGGLIGVILGGSLVAGECRDKGEFEYARNRYECQKLDVQYVRPANPPSSRAHARVSGEAGE